MKPGPDLAGKALIRKMKEERCDKTEL